MMRHKVLPTLGVAATLLGVFLLYRIFEKQDFGELAEAATSVRPADLALALMFTMASFTCISLIEFLGVHYVRRPVPWQRIVLTAVSALGIGHAIGLAALSSGAIRYRMYGRADLGIVSTGKIVVFAALTTASGLGTVGGVSLIWQADTLAPLLNIAPDTLRFVGMGMLVLLLAYFLVCSFSPTRIVKIWRRVRVRVPSARFALAQFVMGSLNVLCIGGVLYATLRSFVEVHYATAAALYVSGDVSAIIAHVPGGWGVLEYIVTSVLVDERVLAGIVLYRGIYYLMPLGIGLIVFVTDELAGRRRTVRARHRERLREAI